MKNELIERLKKVLKILELNTKKAAELTDIPYRTLQNYLLNLREPTVTNLVKIATRLGINLHWLLTGEGSMWAKKEDKVGKEKFIDWINHFYETASEKEINWFEVQFEKCFPEFREWKEKRK